MLGSVGVQLFLVFDRDFFLLKRSFLRVLVFVGGIGIISAAVLIIIIIIVSCQLR